MIKNKRLTELTPEINDVKETLEMVMNYLIAFRVATKVVLEAAAEHLPKLVKGVTSLMNFMIDTYTREGIQAMSRDPAQLGDKHHDGDDDDGDKKGDLAGEKESAFWRELLRRLTKYTRTQLILFKAKPFGSRGEGEGKGDDDSGFSKKNVSGHFDELLGAPSGKYMQRTSSSSSSSSSSSTSTSSSGDVGGGVKGKWTEEAWCAQVREALVRDIISVGFNTVKSKSLGSITEEIGKVCQDKQQRQRLLQLTGIISDVIARTFDIISEKVYLWKGREIREREKERTGERENERDNQILFLKE